MEMNRHCMSWRGVCMVREVMHCSSLTCQQKDLSRAAISSAHIIADTEAWFHHVIFYQRSFSATRNFSVSRSNASHFSTSAGPSFPGKNSPLKPRPRAGYCSSTSKRHSETFTFPNTPTNSSGMLRLSGCRALPATKTWRMPTPPTASRNHVSSLWPAR